MGRTQADVDGRVVVWERLLDLDQDLAETMGEGAVRVRDRIGVPTIRLDRGPWDLDTLRAVARNAFALMVCDGLVVRELELAETLTADLLGPGDIVALEPPTERLLITGESWHVGKRATVAILDDRLLPALHAWALLSARLIARAGRQAARAAEQRAISQLPRVELRLRALMWHLAERWGRVGTTGVVVPIEITHGALGRLVGPVDRRCRSPSPSWPATVQWCVATTAPGCCAPSPIPPLRRVGPARRPISRRWHRSRARTLGPTGSNRDPPGQVDRRCR